MLFERAAQIERLSEVLDEVRAGAGRLILLEGPAGVGKTALLNEARRLAGAAGMGTLVAHAGEFERDFPFAIVRQLLEPPVVAASDEMRKQLLAGPAATAQTVLGTARLAAVFGEGHPAEVLHSLYWLTANLAARRPLLLAVDDVHWTDAASVRWLAYLRPRLEELPVALVLAMRSLTPDHDPALLELSADPRAAVIRVAALSDGSVGELLEERLGRQPDSVFTHACQEATGGNPFLLRELAAALAHDRIAPTAQNAGRVAGFGPRSVARAIRLRLLSLPPSGTALVSAVAVLGPGASWRHAAALASLPDDEVADVADRLAALSVLEPGTTLEFAHPIVRAAVHEELPASERGRLHARAAQLIADDEGPPEDVAAHLLFAPSQGREWVVDALLRSARMASARGSAEHALACLRRALDEPPLPARRAVVLRELGAAEVRLGAGAGLSHLHEARVASADVRADAHTALELGTALVARGRVADAAAVFADSIERVEAVDRELTLRLEAELLAAARLDASALPRIQAQLAGHHRELLPGDTPSERLLLAVLALDAVLAGRPVASVVDLAQRALHGILEDSEQIAHSPPLNQAAYALIISGRFDDAAMFYDAALRVAQAHGSVIGFAITSCWRSHLEHRRGAIDRAEAEARSSLHAADSAEWRLGQPAALAFLIDALVERGALDEAEALLTRHQLPEDRESVLAQGLIYSRGVLRLAQRRPAEALAQFLRAGEHQRRWMAENPAVMAWRSAAALAQSALGQDEIARELADEELARAGEFGEPRAVGVALRVAGMVHTGATRLEYLEEAVNVLEPSSAGLEYARALVELGAARRRRGQRSAAREPLRHGLDLAQRCAAVALAEQAHTELLATGARPRRAALSGVDSLTPSERRLAEMAADGMSNREISHAVFVTMKTVEAHLRSIYRKLDIDSRKELASVLGRTARV